MPKEPTGPQPRLVLCDPDPAVLEAWKAQFLKRPEVEIHSSHPLEVPADALLLPGNSFGFLDSGLELEAIERFGWDIQDELRDRIRESHDGELLVGQALVVHRPNLPWALIYAPIWRTPAPLGETVHVFLAVRGAYLALRRDDSLAPDARLAVPGMGVGDPGLLDPAVSARQIRYAYEMASGQRGPGAKNLSQCTRRQRKLQTLPITNRPTTPEA